MMRKQYLCYVVSALVSTSYCSFPVAIAQEQSDTPAFLQFAESYNQEWALPPSNNKPFITPPPAQEPTKQLPPPSTPTQNERKAPNQKKTLKNPQVQKKNKLTDRNIDINNKEINHQPATNEQLQKERDHSLKQAVKKANNLEVEKEFPVTPADMQKLAALIQAFRQSLQPGSNVLQLTDKLKLAYQQLEYSQTQLERLNTEIQNLKNQLQESQRPKEITNKQNNPDVLKEIDLLKTQLSTLEQDNQALQRHLSNEKKITQEQAISTDQLIVKLQEAKDIEKKITAQKNDLYEKNLALQKQLDIEKQQLAEMAQKSTTPLSKMNGKLPKDKKIRQAYASGIALGEDILQLQGSQKKLGINFDEKYVLAGILDAFEQRSQLDSDELSTILEEIERILEEAQKKTVDTVNTVNKAATEKKSAKSYLDEFKKDKAVKKADFGFWYRIEYLGDSSFSENDIVSIIVKEMLTNGSVIKDMELSGSVLAQPLNTYPPLFQNALKLLKNHGQITIVVPPELAYGEQGYPPKIPPNATMVYQLRIVDTQPNQAKRK